MRTPVPRNGHVPRTPVRSELGPRRSSLRDLVDLADLDLGDDDVRESDVDPSLDLDDDGLPEAPWAPMPLERARTFAREHDAQIEVFFPTVYEEDRTAKLADLTTAQTVRAIAHRRMSEQMARELGFEHYDYDEEQAEIATEMPLPSGALAPDEPGENLDALDQAPRRADLSNDATHAFRKSQRSTVSTSERESEPPFRWSMRAELDLLRQELRELREALTVRHLDVERDDKGLMTKIVERRVVPPPKGATP
jgi:hypothetical protein